MPPSSRKRNKGKERKAKKEAKLKMNLPKDLQTPWRVWALEGINTLLQPWV